MHCTVIVHVNDLLVNWKDESTIVGVIETLKDKYHDMHEHTE